MSCALSQASSHPLIQHSSFYLVKIFGCCQGILTERDGSVRLASLYYVVHISCFSYLNYFLHMNISKKRWSTVLSLPSVRFPWSCWRNGMASCEMPNSFETNIFVFHKSNFARSLCYKTFYGHNGTTLLTKFLCHTEGAAKKVFDIH